MKKFCMKVIMSLIIPSIAFSEINPDQIVKKADLKRGLGNISHSFNVTVIDQDNKTENFHVSFKDVNYSLTEQTQPERARGRKLLMRNYDIWLFTPNIKKALRISLEQKLSGQVSNGDIARTNYAEDYEAKLLGIDKINNQEVYRLDLKAKTTKLPTEKLNILFRKKIFLLLRQHFLQYPARP